MKKMQTKIGLTIGVAVVALLVFTASAAAQTSITVGSATVDSGDTFTINVTLSNTPTAGVGAYGFNITFDPLVVQVKEVTNLPGSGIPNWNNDTGWVKFGGAAYPGVGDGIYGNITFEAVGANGTSTTLDITVDTLKDADSNLITYTVTNGSVTVGEVTVTSVTVESKTVAESETTTIDVTLSDTPALVGVGAYGFNITFDPLVVQVKEVTNLPGSGIPNWNNDTGWVKFGGAAYPGVGDGIFGNITFEAVGANGTSTTLDITVDTLKDADSNIITYTVTNGSVTVGEPAEKVVINEFMSNNATEWVELFNNGSSDVDLTGWTLEDEVGNSKSLSGLGTIAAGGYKVFTYSGTWLNNDGDVIWLNSTTENIDRVGYDGTSGGAPAPDAGNSTGRYPNGVDTDNDANDFTEFGTPTPGAENRIIQLMEGDANLDNCVSLKDSTLIKQYMAGLKALTSDQRKCADTWDDDAVTLKDSTYIKQWLVNPATTLWQSPADDDMLEPVEC